MKNIYELWEIYYDMRVKRNFAPHLIHELPRCCAAQISDEAIHDLQIKFKIK